MATTRTYLHLAGTVFRDEAARLEDRLLGEASGEGYKVVPAEDDLSDLRRPEATVYTGGHLTDPRSENQLF